MNPTKNKIAVTAALAGALFCAAAVLFFPRSEACSPHEAALRCLAAQKAASFGDEGAAKRLTLAENALLRLAENPENLRKTDIDGNTVLHIAARGNDIRIVERLVELGADPTAKNLFGETPLRTARNGEIRNFFRAYEETDAAKASSSKSARRK